MELYKKLILDLAIIPTLEYNKNNKERGECYDRFYYSTRSSYKMEYLSS